MNIEEQLIDWYMRWIYLLGLYLRGWRGPGSPYPYQYSEPDPLLIDQELRKWDLLVRVLGKRIYTVEDLDRMSENLGRILISSLPLNKKDKLRDYLKTVVSNDSATGKVAAHHVGRMYLTSFGDNGSGILPMLERHVQKTTNSDLTSLANNYREDTTAFFRDKDMITRLDWPTVILTGEYTVDLIRFYNLKSVSGRDLTSILEMVTSPCKLEVSRELIETSARYLSDSATTGSSSISQIMTKFIESQYDQEVDLLNHGLMMGVISSNWWLSSLSEMGCKFLSSLTRCS